MNDQNKETAIQDEQQLKSKQDIINEIIDILADNKIPIIDAKNILYTVSKEICRQLVRPSS